MKRWIPVLALTLMALTGCDREIVDSGLPPVLHPRVLVINGLSETADLYDVERDTLLPSVFVTGKTPNFLLSHNGKFYLVNSGYGGPPSLQVIDPRSLTVEAEAPLPNGSNPMQVAILGDNLYVTSFTLNRVYKLNASLQVVDSVQVGRAPDGILAYNGKLYVVATFYDLATYQSDTGKLYVLAPDLQVEDSLILSLNPQKIAEDSGYLYILGGDWTLGGGYLLQVDPATLTITNTANITAGVPGALDIDHHTAYITGWSIPGIVPVELPSLQVGPLVDFSTAIDSTNGVMGLDVVGDTAFVALFSNSAQVNDYLLILTLQGHILERVVLGQGKGAQIVRYYQVED